jgi:hypothetical protein
MDYQMNYSFSLEWHELSVELQSDKIDTYIMANAAQYKTEFAEAAHYPALDGDELADAIEQVTDEEILENEQLREDAEQAISARFPMYF